VRDAGFAFRHPVVPDQNLKIGRGGGE